MVSQSLSVSSPSLGSMEATANISQERKSSILKDCSSLFLDSRLRSKAGSDYTVGKCACGAEVVVSKGCFCDGDNGLAGDSRVFVAARAHLYSKTTT